MKAAIAERLNAHDLLGVLPHGAPEDEYNSEMEDFARLIAGGVFITPEVVAAVWHKWFGEGAEPEAPTHGMLGLAADLRAIGQDFTTSRPAG